MVLVFLALSVSYVGLFAALRPYLRTVAGRVSLALFLVSALGLAIAAAFTTDPVTVGPDAVKTEGTIHNLIGTLGFAMPFAAAIIGQKLARNPAWFSARWPVLWATGLALAAFLVSFAWLGVVVAQSGGTFGPGVPAGWPGRFEILAYAACVMVARQAIRVPGQPPRAKEG